MNMSMTMESGMRRVLSTSQGRRPGWRLLCGLMLCTTVGPALGQGRDELYVAECDTMFVMTDGVPTIPGAQGAGTTAAPTGPPAGGRAGAGRGPGGGDRLAPDSTEAILEATLRWNVCRRVVIHTIGLGDRFSGSFLESLAKENGGNFVSER